MAIRKWYGLLVAGGLVGVIAAGCSSSNETAGGDAGDAAVRRMLDGAISISSDDSGATGAFDGTTGKACKQDSDCVGADGGAGINVCSTSVTAMITGVSVANWATPVCLIPPSPAGNCDPVPGGVDDGLPHFCDGPDDPSSPGYCFPFDLNNPQPGQGSCYPLCTFGLDGQKPTGCVGTDVCFPVTFLLSSTTSTVTGYGFCAGGCDKDADCADLGAGYVCQTDIGYCTMTKVPRTKAIGAACMAATAAGTPDDIACNCDSDPTTGVGICASSCIVGGEPCASGQICDAGFQNPIVFTSSAGGTPVSIPVTAQNTAIPGICRDVCTPADAGVAMVDAGPAPEVDGGGDASADAAVPVVTGPVTCPANTTCQIGDVVGPDCIP